MHLSQYTSAHTLQCVKRILWGADVKFWFENYLYTFLYSWYLLSWIRYKTSRLATCFSFSSTQLQTLSPQPIPLHFILIIGYRNVEYSTETWKAMLWHDSKPEYAKPKWQNVTDKFRPNCLLFEAEEETLRNYEDSLVGTRLAKDSPTDCAGPHRRVVEMQER